MSDDRPECPQCAKDGKKVKMAASIQGPPGKATVAKYQCPNCAFVMAATPEGK